MRARLALTTALVASILSAAAPRVAPAASNGLAWDSVTKLMQNTDPSSLQPGSFADDFAAASAVQTPPQTGGGLYEKYKQAMAMAQSMQAMMKTGLAEKHYVAGTKERTDSLVSQTATITDCAARTITTLDLRNKTYKVESMDQPSSGSGGGGGGGVPANRDEVTHVAIAVVNQALGALQFGGRQTSGYRSNITVTETRASGETSTHQMNMTGYYSSLAHPFAQCSRFDQASRSQPNQPGAAMTGGVARLMQALASAGLDKRISITQSGPTVPLGNLSMWDAATFSMQSHGGQAAFVMERGNVRSIDANDPAFSIPSDFTKQQ